MKLVPIAGVIGAAVLVASMLPGPFSDVRSVSRTPVLEGAQVNGTARDLMARACLNCHSNSTEWPWYANVAPVAWMLRRDVANARKVLNFSLWREYGMEGQSQLLMAAASQLEMQTMPPRRYSAIHPEARLTEGERVALEASLRDESYRLVKESHPERMKPEQGR